MNLMSKSANAGELKTPVYFKTTATSINGQGFPVDHMANVFGSDVPVMCTWVNAHGSEVWNAMQLKLRSPDTITCRYSPLLNDETLIIFCGTDPKPYEVISCDNVEHRNEWLEIKVQRKVAAR